VSHFQCFVVFALIAVVMLLLHFAWATRPNQ